MAVDERARHSLFLRVEQELGPEAAETLMELLPPVGWADVATKEDLHQLEERISLRLDAKLSELRGDLGDRMHAQFRNLVVLNSSLVFAMAGLAFAAAKLA
jgi:hypothetical protein